jgi:thiol-disulfide isomerase/thioredoxin
MKQLTTSLAAVAFLFIAANSAFAQSPVDYKTAFSRAQKGDKPLLVLVTAQWCPPCQVMKKTTIPQLVQKNAFKHCHFASVDFDEQNDVAMQLTGGRGVPQLVMYEKRDGKWVRRYIAGYKTANVVEAFMAQSKLVRTAQLADAASNGTQKK